jgi:hypothetical protein
MTIRVHAYKMVTADCANCWHVILQCEVSCNTSHACSSMLPNISWPNNHHWLTVHTRAMTCADVHHWARGVVRRRVPGLVPSAHVNHAVTGMSSAHMARHHGKTSWQDIMARHHGKPQWPESTARHKQQQSRRAMFPFPSEKRISVHNMQRGHGAPGRRSCSMSHWCKCMACMVCDLGVVVDASTLLVMQLTCTH